MKLNCIHGDLMTDALIGVAHRVAMECDLIYSRRNGHTPLIVDMWIRIHFLAIRIQQFSQSGSGFSGKKTAVGLLNLLKSTLIRIEKKDCSKV